MKRFRDIAVLKVRGHPTPGVGIRDRVPGIPQSRSRKSKTGNGTGTQIQNVTLTKEFRDSVPGTDNFPGPGPVPTPALLSSLKCLQDTDW